ncbi:MAG: aldose 1-epimerase [Acidimicrobiales bacterium]
MDQLKISSDGAKATIETQGGRLGSLEIGGNEVLVTDGPKPTRWGSFPMVPWCGRLPDGRLQHAHNTYEFPLTGPGTANHGLVHTKPWTVVQHTDSVVKIVTELESPWVFGGTVSQRFELDQNALLVEVQIEAGEWAMPVMAGWHPWFRRQLEIGGQAELRVEPGQQYELDDAMVPTGTLIDISPQPWDDCFIGLASPPVISWPGAFDLTVSSSFDHWVIFTEPEHAICVEPQSGPPNEVNRAPKIIEPGQRFFGWMGMTWTTVQA